MMGNKPGALASMRASIALDGEGRRESLRQDTDFASLHGDPDFDELTKPKKKARKRR